jgi:hypothetical protein
MNANDPRKRDKAIVEYIRRYHMGTPESLAKRICPELSANALKKTLQRLVKRGVLRRFPLYQQRFYYILSRQVCQELQLSLRRSMPLGHEGLVQHLAVLVFCEQCNLQLLTQQEFTTHFPELYRPHLPSGYYFLEPAAGSLGWIMVDHGSRPDRLVSKVGRVIGKRYALPEFAKVIQADAFSIALVTATALKKQAIERALLERPRKHVSVQVHVIPELAPLLVGANSHAPISRPKA